MSCIDLNAYLSLFKQADPRNQYIYMPKRFVVLCSSFTFITISVVLSLSSLVAELLRVVSEWFPGGLTVPGTITSLFK